MVVAPYQKSRLPGGGGRCYQTDAVRLAVVVVLGACATGGPTSETPDAPGHPPPPIDAPEGQEPDGSVPPMHDGPVLATGSSLLLTEVVLAPSAGEFIEIANPTGATVDLTNYYVSDSGNYFKMPNEIGDRDIIVVDPMIATGNSAIAAVERIKTAGPKSIKFVCILASPEGLANFHEVHPEVPIFTAAIDERLDDNGYILPGLGDAGDRLFGTK